MEQLDERALPEWAAFAATLARKLADLLPRGRVALGDPVWIACVDNFLLKAVDIDSQVSNRFAVLRRLLSCSYLLKAVDTDLQIDHFCPILQLT